MNSLIRRFNRYERQAGLEKQCQRRDCRPQCSNNYRAMIPPNASLIRYENAVLVGTGKGQKGATKGISPAKKVIVFM